ncbi:cell division protein FtsA [Petrotoga sp. 9PWA.NaAc.5.4]|uniref:cell division protein FtsA n=1 Tax=Petrotoga sp. 9PWA.NaAc.5.4 TaxID=1434328 RepID=UPI000CA6735B|nr:cell division FtsA domain-containing protein [Petrotoga sp. 9PWA.NaAc.5.4]PNR92554.1 hypothetical protein X924_09280 [Petrotoga sp. 9PWA.NaAc.5.4]
MTKSYLIGLDIGSFFIKGVLFEVGEDEKIRPISFAKLPVEGIINGEIQDVESLRRTIFYIIDKLKEDLQKKFKNPEIVVGYSTNSLSITQENFTVEFSQKTEIREKELYNIKRNITKKYIEEGKIILDVSFVKFIIDDKTVKNPVSFFAERTLTTSLNIVWVDGNAFSLLINVLKDIVPTSQIPVYDSTLSTSYLVTTANDRSIGITVIDLGYNSCRLIIFKDGIPKLFYSFPYGIKYVLKDISNVLKVSEKEAHRLLSEEGACLRDTKIVKKVDFQLLTGTGYSYVPLSLLNKIIFARVREIISRLNGELSKIGYEKTFEVGALQGGIVLTGGGSKIRNIEQTVKELMGENFRKGSFVSTDSFQDVPDELKKDPEYLPVFGIIDKYRLDLLEESSTEKIKEQQYVESPKKSKDEPRGKIFKTFIKKITGGDEDAV